MKKTYLKFFKYNILRITMILFCLHVYAKMKKRLAIDCLKVHTL